MGLVRAEISPPKSDTWWYKYSSKLWNANSQNFSMKCFQLEIQIFILQGRGQMASHKPQKQITLLWFSVMEAVKGKEGTRR